MQLNKYTLIKFIFFIYVDDIIMINYIYIYILKK